MSQNQNGSGIDLEFIRNLSRIIGKFIGISMDLESKSYELCGNLKGNSCRVAGNRVGTFMGIRINYLGNLRLFMGNSWGMRGDFSLGIRSSEEVQLPAAHIHTHATSLTKPRFPFYVRTGLFWTLFWLLFRSLVLSRFFKVF